MSGFPKFLTVLGRMCIGILFLLGGINVIMNWRATESHLTGMLSDWQSSLAQSEAASEFIALLLSWVPVILVVGLILELLGGLLVFIGVKVRFGSVLLVLFLVPVTIIYHHFWLMDGARRNAELGMFLKNLAIFGGVLYVLAVGKKNSAKQGAGGGENKKK